MSAISAMNQSLRDNRALRKKRRTVKEISENHKENPAKIKQDKPRLSAAEFERFKQKLKKERRKSNMIELVVILTILLLFGYFMLWFLGIL